MKSRLGFVSNSSSSSYILRSGSVAEIATDMTKVIIDSWRNPKGKLSASDTKHAKTRRRQLKEALSHPRVVSGEIGVVFSSCNFDTYIISINGVIYIATSRNYNWSDLISDWEYVEHQDWEGGGYHDVYNVVSDNLFLNAKTNRIHYGKDCDVPVAEDHPCPNCGNKFGYCVKTEDGENLCAWCFDGILGNVDGAKAD
jgi:hypothetical protein